MYLTQVCGDLQRELACGREHQSFETVLLVGAGALSLQQQNLLNDRQPECQRLS